MHLTAVVSCFDCRAVLSRTQAHDKTLGASDLHRFVFERGGDSERLRSLFCFTTSDNSLNGQHTNVTDVGRSPRSPPPPPPPLILR